MLKFTVPRPDGTVMLFLGLTRASLELLPQDKPIVVELAPLGIGGRRTGRPGTLASVVLFAGETEEEITADLLLKGLISRDTKITMDPDPHIPT